MNIYIRYYQNQFGNCSTDSISIKNTDMLVSELKDAIQEKFRVSPSKQRLTYKIGEEFLVMLTDEWRLSFFHIKPGSHIYLEIIEEVNKQEEINKKILSATKSKYLKSLGFFNHFSSNLGVIPESTNEYNDEIFSNKRSHVLNHSFTQDEQLEVFLNAVKNNNINQVKELFDQYENLDVNSIGNNGWAALHTACFNGFTEIVVELLAHKANPNILNNEEWSALHLASYKGHDEVVKILINAPDININILHSDIGTPLHCACKKNFMKVVSLLLFKADIEVVDSDGKKAQDLCNDKNIIKLIQRHKKHKENKSGQVDLSQFPYLKTLSFIPPKPPKTVGFIEKMGMMIFSWNLRFLELDALAGTLKRYVDIEDYPNKPHEVIPLKNISICKKIDSFYYSKSYHYFELVYEQRQVFRLPLEQSSLQWIEILIASIIYSKFFSKIMPNHPEIVQYFSKVKEEALMIEFKPEQDEKYKQSKLSSKHIVKTQKQEPEKVKPNAMNNKKKERRKNPYTQGEDEDIDLAEDSSKLYGITFESFDILSILGSGSFGKVYKVKLKATEQIFAMKVINKKFLIKNQQLRYAVTECNVLKQLNHPFILKLHYAFQTPDHLYMILDFCPGGDLSFHIVRNLFEEDEAQFFIAELILAIEHLHSHDIIYRDLKPENILIDVDGHIKLADFGLAKEGVGNDRTAQSFCGSPAYLSPEMVNRRGAGKAADIYGIGAVLYEMISGTPPFYANDLGTMYKNIAKSKLMMHDYFSDELQSLLKRLLNRDPKIRIGVNDKSEIKDHEFFSNLDWDRLIKKKLKPPIDLNEYKTELDSNAFGKSNEKDKNKVIFKDKDYSSENGDLNRVKNFTFISKEK